MQNVLHAFEFFRNRGCSQNDANERANGFDIQFVIPIVYVSLETALTVFRLFDMGFCLFHISCEYNSPFIQSHQHCTHFRRFRLFLHLFILSFSHLTSIFFY